MKYPAISSTVGGCSSKLLPSLFPSSPIFPVPNADAGTTLAATFELVYRSSNSALPRFTTGIVAYTGILLNCGMCLQQCAYAPRWSRVGCVSRMTDSVETCWVICSSFDVAKVESQPTSMRILTPPSSSSREEEAGEADCAPSRGVKVNMLSFCAGCDYSSIGGALS